MKNKKYNVEDFEKILLKFADANGFSWHYWVIPAILLTFHLEEELKNES